MSSIIRNKKENIRVQDISESGIIDYKDYKKVIELKTVKQKLNQNKEFIKAEKQYNYSNKVVDIKKNLTSQKEKINNESQNSKTKESISNNLVKINSIKDDYKANERFEKSYKPITKNNRFLLSKRVLKMADKGIDELLSVNEDDLGLYTIRKTKNGLKRVSVIGDKGIRLNKMLMKKAYRVVTGENAKNLYKTSRDITKKVYENTRDFSTKVYIRGKIGQATKGNQILKNKQRKEQLKKVRKKAKEKAENLVKEILTNLKNVVVEIFTKKTILVGLIIFILILTLVSSIIGVTTLFAYSTNLVIDEESEYIYDYISELDKNINMQINNAKIEHPRS